MRSRQHGPFRWETAALIGKVDERTVASSLSRLQLELDQPPWPFGGVRPQEL